MAENETPGWFGSYSNAGRSSAGQYQAIVNKDKILNENNNRLVLKDLFTPDPIIKEKDDIIEHIDIFKTHNPIQTNTQSPSNNALSSPKDKFLDNDRLKYHNKHINDNKNKHKKEEEQTSFKYNPKMEYIWNRSVSGPHWKTVTGRRHKKIFDNKDFYINHVNLKDSKQKCFIELKRQTMRIDFPTPSDLRISNQRKYDSTQNSSTLPNPNSPGGFSYKHGKLTSRNSCNTTSLFNSPKNAETKEKTMKQSHSQRTMGRNLFQKTENDKKSSMKRTISLNQMSIDTKCYVPDFKRCLSRAQLDRRFRYNKGDTPFCYPNYKFVTERPVMMVSYDKPSYHKKKITLQGIDPGMMFDPHKVIDKVNNHQSTHVLSFKNTTSRPDGDNDTLPSYMKNIFTKASGFTTTDKTLKMNNYAESKYMNESSSFFPKRSFNKLVNLNLLNSKEISENELYLKGEYQQIATLMKKTMQYHKKNLNELINETDLKQVDTVTFKGFKMKPRSSNQKTENFFTYYEKSNMSN